MNWRGDDFLKAKLSYDPDSGLFIWQSTGTRAGSLEAKGYIVIETGRKRYKAHRLAWWFMTGHWPDYPREQVDHINGIKSDNRFCNLRIATNAQNKRNSHFLRSDNTSGFRCVNWRPDMGRWSVSITMPGEKRQTKCGTFSELPDAVACANTIMAYAYGRFARLNPMPEGYSHD